MAMFFCVLEEDGMVDGYMTINEISEKWNVSSRRVRAMCLNGQISGATKVGRTWVIPSDAEKPKDGRVVSGDYKNWRKKQE